jgi:hypothetical protein
VIRGYRLELAMTADELLVYAACRELQDELRTLHARPPSNKTRLLMIQILGSVSDMMDELETKVRERLDQGFKPFTRTQESKFWWRAKSRGVL